MAIEIHGFAPREGALAFAFMVVRVGAPLDREAMRALVCGLGPLVLGLDEVVAEIPEELEDGLRIVSLPWQPPEGDELIAAQRAVLDGANALGVEAMWFLQTGTHLPMVGAQDEGEDEGDDDDEDDGADEAADEDAEDDGSWSFGPPPQTREVRFPVDNYPEILEAFDWEDFGIACKLGGAWLAGEATVLSRLHALWLGPYGGRHRNAAVTIDQDHHAVHFWVDRFAAPCETRELVHHLLWIVSKLDEIFPVLHARFEGATMAQKYGSLVGDTSAPFVLGGNPLRPVYAIGGDAAVDAWLASQTAWSNDEVACMLRELAMDVLSAPPDAPEAAADDDASSSEVELDVDAMFDAAFTDDDEDDEDDDDKDDDEAEDEAEDEAADDENHVSRPARYMSLPMVAGEILAARARAGVLDPRVHDMLSAIPTHDAADPRLSAARRVLTAVADHAAPDDHDVN